MGVRGGMWARQRRSVSSEQVSCLRTEGSIWDVENGHGRNAGSWPAPGGGDRTGLMVEGVKGIVVEKNEGVEDIGSKCRGGYVSDEDELIAGGCCGMEVVIAERGL